MARISLSRVSRRLTAARLKHNTGMGLWELHGAGLAFALMILSGCAENYNTSSYATVAARTLVTQDGVFEVLDRPDIERLAIRQTADCTEGRTGERRQVPLKAGILSSGCGSAWESVTKLAGKMLPSVSGERGHVVSPGSAFAKPLEFYFSNSSRECRLLRGHQLVGDQWEFVYSCQPGVDPTKVTWGPNGMSQIWPLR